MVWDFTEANMLGEKAICWHNAVDITAGAISTLGSTHVDNCSARQIDAATGANGVRNLLISTDPPYYDNIGYAALSDFFYVWLRRTIGNLFPNEFSTVLVPKMPELIASPELFGGDKELARQHFEDGFRASFLALRREMDNRLPMTVYYAFKQDDEDEAAEDNEEGIVDLTTGWETSVSGPTRRSFAPRRSCLDYSQSSPSGHTTSPNPESSRREPLHGIQKRS